MQVEEAFGRVLRTLRTAKGLTQEQLGFEAGLRRTFISSLELGDKQPSLSTIFKLSTALGTPMSAIFKLLDDALDIQDDRKM